MATLRQRQNVYAITLVCLQRHRHFQLPANAELFITTLFRYRDAGKFRLHAYVVMPDHIHVLLTPAIDQPTSRIIQLLKGGYSHACASASAGHVWSPGHHEHRVRDLDDFIAQKRYIEANPGRKDLEPYPYLHTKANHPLDPVA